jgi:hypothetical protein
MTDWSAWDHAYGPAEDIPGLLDRAAIADDHADRPLRPADPDALHGLGRRMFDTASSHGQDNACPLCQTRFTVAEVVL